MNEKSYRLCMASLLAVFVIGVLVIGYRFSDQVAENGRYVQFDLSKASRPDGAMTVHAYETWVIDTRSGQLAIRDDPRNP